MLVNLKWLENYLLLIKFVKLILDLEKITEYEAFINSTDEGFDAEDSIFIWLYL